MTSCSCARAPGAEHLVGCVFNPSNAREYAQRALVLAYVEAYAALGEDTE